MGFFPFFTDIKNKNCVVVGGGNIAYRKVEKLIYFEPHITVIAPDICEDLKSIGSIQLISRAFCDSDIDDAFMVITATDDKELNRHIFQLCADKRIPVNTVDDISNCSFIFPALAHRNNITIGISTSGESPVFARYIKERINDILNDRNMDIAELLGRYRPVIKERISSEQQRKKAVELLLEMCITTDILPSESDIDKMLEAFIDE